MDKIFLDIKNVSESLAQNYGLDIRIFLIIYLVSFLPFYLGYFLMLHGSTRSLKFVDLFDLGKIKEKIRWNQQVTLGLSIHLFGRVMPYVYIMIYGKNLPLWSYTVILLIIILSVLFFLYKFFLPRGHKIQGDISIHKKAQVTDSSEIESLWNIYNETFDPLNRISPCKQSLDHTHFVEALHDSSVTKYILFKDGFGFLGISLVTNDFKNTPWISEDYFKFKYPDQYSKKIIYYFMGLAIHKKFRGNRYSISLIEHVVDDFPKDVIIGFDHSLNINPTLHFFTHVIKQSRYIKRTHIDRQHYHIVEYKK